MPLLTGITINVNSPDTTLELGVNESYTLSITTSGAQLSAETVWGALRGLETFIQTVDYSDSMGYFISGVSVQITDSPRFAWRGFLVDTSRHYLSVQKLMEIVDALSYSKFNVLHWHAVDAQSFPLVIPVCYFGHDF